MSKLSLGRETIAQSLHNAAILKWLKDQAAEGNEAVIGTLNESQVEMRAIRMIRGALQFVSRRMRPTDGPLTRAICSV